MDVGIIVGEWDTRGENEIGVMAFPITPRYSHASEPTERQVAGVGSTPIRRFHRFKAEVQICVLCEICG